MVSGSLWESALLVRYSQNPEDSNDTRCDTRLFSWEKHYRAHARQYKLDILNGEKSEDEPDVLNISLLSYFYELYIKMTRDIISLMQEHI